MVVVALSNPFTREKILARIEQVDEFEDIGWRNYFARFLTEDKMAEYRELQADYQIRTGHVWSDPTALRELLEMVDE